MPGTERRNEETLEVFERENNRLNFNTLSPRKLLSTLQDPPKSLLGREANLRTVSMLVFRMECAHPRSSSGKGGRPPVWKAGDGTGAGRKRNSGEGTGLGDWETQGRHLNMVEVFNRDKAF